MTVIKKKMKNVELLISGISKTHKNTRGGEFTLGKGNFIFR